MSAASRLLDRLDGAARTGDGRWKARCPAHDDRSPSLSIREAGDGLVLIYCFAGCGAAEVVAAVGLDLADLFPPRQAQLTNTFRRAPRIPASDALLMVENESLVVVFIAEALAKGEPVETHREELLRAAARIAAVRRAWMERP